MVEHRIRIADRAVRNRHGPPMGYVAECKDCGLVHKLVFWTTKDQLLLFLIAYHSERKPRHRIDIVSVDIDGGLQIDDDELLLPLIPGWIEPPDIGI